MLHLHLVPRSRTVELYLHCFLCLMVIRDRNNSTFTISKHLMVPEVYFGNHLPILTTQIIHIGDIFIAIPITVGQTVSSIAVCDKSNNHHCQKSPFWVTAFLKKILPDCIRFSLLRISWQFFFKQSKIICLAFNPNQEDQVPVFMSPSDSVAQLYPEAQCLLSVAFYDSQVFYPAVLRGTLPRATIMTRHIVW
jgi:hypothetical protein